jgi:hypothetical protein
LITVSFTAGACGAKQGAPIEGALLRQVVATVQPSSLKRRLRPSGSLLRGHTRRGWKMFAVVPE